MMIKLAYYYSTLTRFLDDHPFCIDSGESLSVFHHEDPDWVWVLSFDPYRADFWTELGLKVGRIYNKELAYFRDYQGAPCRPLLFTDYIVFECEKLINYFTSTEKESDMLRHTNAGDRYTEAYNSFKWCKTTKFNACLPQQKPLEDLLRIAHIFDLTRSDWSLNNVLFRSTGELFLTDVLQNGLFAPRDVWFKPDSFDWFFDLMEVSYDSQTVVAPNY